MQLLRFREKKKSIIVCPSYSTWDFNSIQMQDFLLDENHNLTEMDGNTGECHLEVKEDIA